MTIEVGGIPASPGNITELRDNLGIVDFSAGGQSAGQSGTLVFSNSNGLSFGLNAAGGSVLTGSYTVPNVAGMLTTAALSNHSHGDPTLALTGLSGSTASASNGLTLSLSAAAQSVQTQNSVLVQGSSGQITFSASNGVTFGGNARTITASVETSYAGSNHSHGNPTLALTNLTGTTASNSNGLTLSLSAAAPGAGGVAVSADGSSQNAGTIVFSNLNGVSFGMDGSTITATVQPGAAAGIAAVEAGTQNATSGTIVFADSNGITFGMSGSSQITASHNGLTTQTVQTQSNVRGLIVSDTTYRTGDVSFSNLNGASFGSNGANVVTMSYTVPSVAGFLTTAALSNHSHGDPTLALTNLSGTTASASNGLTLSLSAAAAVAQTNQAVGLYATGNTTQNSSTTLDARSITFNGLGAATLGFSNGSVQVSVPVQSAQTQSNVQGIVVSDTTFRTGDVSFSNLNGISFGSNGANVVTLSHNGLTTAAASNHSHGNPTLALTNLSGTTASASNGLTLSLSAAAQSAQTQSNVQGLIVSDTTYRTGDVSFSNANGISFGSSAGQAVTISHGLQFTSATSAITSNALNTSASRVINIVAATNNTGGGTASLSSNVSFSAANGLTFYTSAGGAIVGSHNALTTARASTDAIGLNTAQTNVTWTVNSSGLSFNAAGYAGTGTSRTGAASLTLNSNGLQFDGAGLAGTSSGFTGANISASITHNTAGLAMSMSVAAPSAATLSAYAVSNTTQSTSGVMPGAVSFQGVGGVSVGVSNGSVVIQGPDLSSIAATGALSASSNGSTISLGVGTVTASIIGNTTQTSTGSINLNALVFSGAGGASLGISAGSIIVSGATGGGGGAGISAGTQSVNTGTVVFSNSNGITFGMSGSSQVTASYNSTQFAGTGTTFAGANASASMTLNSAGLNLSVSVAAPGAAAEANAHNLLGANTAGNTTATGSTIGLSGVNLTLSGTNASQIVISAPATSSLVGASGLSISTNGSTISLYRGAVLSRFLYEPPGASSAGSAMTQGSMSFQRVVIPDDITITRVDIPVLIAMTSSAAANTGNLLISSGLVIYSAAGSTLNPIVGAFGTTTYTHASNTANYNSVTGPRLLSFPIATVLPPGEYFVGVQLSTNNNSSIGTATTAIPAAISLQHGAIYTASQWAEFGAATATSVNMRPFVGVAASVTATGQTQQLSNITQTGTALMRANIPVGFRA